MTLLSPFISFKTTIELKPQIVLLFDNSESQQILPGWNKEYVDRIISTFEKELNFKYKIHSVLFSDKTYSIDSLNFKGKSTNISQALIEATDKSVGDHIVSVALFSDGIYNKGNNPIYTPINKNIIVNTVLVGDTTDYKDLSIGEIEYSKYAYLNEILTVNIDVLSQNLSSQKSTITISEVLSSGKLIQLSKNNIAFNTNSTFETNHFSIQPKSEGLHHYKVEVSCLSVEKNCSNNFKDIFIEVVNGKKNILIIANAPHPDLSAIISSISKNSNFIYNIYYSPLDSKLKFEDYDLVVLHQLPSLTDNLSSIASKLNKSKLPLLYIIGSQSNFNILSNQLTGFTFSKFTNASNQVLLPVYNQKFNLFMLDQKTIKDMKYFPPLFSPFVMVQNNMTDLNLMNQKIGSIETNQPLIGFNNNDQLTGIIVGENIWKWKLSNYFNFKNTEAFDDIVFKTLNYMTIKKDKTNFRVTIEKQIFNENENVNLSAVLYNSVYQQVTDGEVSLILHSQNFQKKEYKFIKEYDFFKLNIGSLPPGYYEYEATSFQEGKSYITKGNFHVASLNIETFNTKANFEEMNTLSQNSSGKLFFLNQLQTMIVEYKKNEISSKLVEQKQTYSLNDLWSVFSLILILFSVELIFRKYIGKL